MSLVQRRQNFLPESVKYTEPGEEGCGLYPLHNGFDQTGKYYTEYSGPDGEIDAEKEPIFYVYSFNSVRKEFDVMSIKFPIRKTQFRRFRSPYHAKTTRWFILERIERCKLIVRSGVLRSFFNEPSRSQIKTTFDQAEDSRVEISCADINEPISYTEINSSPDILLIVCKDKSRNFYKKSSLDKYRNGVVVHLIKFNDERLTLFKEISLPNSGHFDLGFDFHSERILGLSNKDLTCFDFSGIQIGQTINLSGLSAEVPTEQSNFEIWQLWNSIFACLWTTRETGGDRLDFVKICRITVTNEIVVLKTIMPSSKVFLYKSIQVFDKCFLVGGSRLDEDEPNSEMAYLCDVDTGEEYFIPNITTEYNDLWQFNWNLGEMAFRKGWIEMKLCITKLPNVFDNSLKHVSRLACLKTFHDDFLKQKLPKCLQRYCGII